MTALKSEICRDYPGRPGCLEIADLRYTMNFDDIGEPPIYWCASCGPQVHEVDASIKNAFMEQGDEFLEKFEKAIKEKEREVS